MGAQLFNSCQFPLKRIHHEDWVEQSHQLTKGLLQACLCFCLRRHMVVRHFRISESFPNALCYSKCENTTPSMSNEAGKLLTLGVLTYGNRGRAELF